METYLDILRKFQKKNPSLLGLFFILSSFFFLSIANAAAKACIKQGIPVLEILLARQNFTLILVIALLWSKKAFSKLSISYLDKHFLRSLFGAMSAALLFTSFGFLPIANATAISFSNGIFLTLLTPYILNEKIKPHVIWGVFIGLAGVTIIANPNDRVNLVGISIAIAAGFFDALGFLYVRVLTKKVSFINTTFYFSLFSIIGCVVLYIVDYELPTLMSLNIRLVLPSVTGLLLLFVVGIFGGLSQILTPLAFKFVSPVIASPFMYTSMIWMAVFGYIFWGEIPDIYFYIGSGLIVTVGILTTLGELYKKQ